MSLAQSVWNQIATRAEALAVHAKPNFVEIITFLRSFVRIKVTDHRFNRYPVARCLHTKNSAHLFWRHEMIKTIVIGGDTLCEHTASWNKAKSGLHLFRNIHQYLCTMVHGHKPFSAPPTNPTQPINLRVPCLLCVTFAAYVKSGEHRA